MKQYSAVLVCRGVEYNTSVNGDIHSDDELTFVLNGIKIHVEFDGNLYIENKDFVNYSDEQLDFLTLCKENNEVILTNYYFKCRIPAAIVNKYTHETTAALIEMKMEHEDTSNHAIRYTYTLLNAKSQMMDIDYAISDLQRQLSNLYNICICGCCKYGQANPYGGDTYLNYLCFRKNKIGYLEFNNGVDKKDWEFFTDKMNAESTRPVYYCKEFE